VGLEEDVHEQPFHRALVHAQLAIAVVVGLWRVLKPVQRRFAGKHRAGRATRFKLFRELAQHGIMAHLIMIVQILVAKRNAVDALGKERLDAMLDPVLPAAIGETGRRLP
jgi:hypothetical protein